MNKPTTILIQETKSKFAQICNDSSLPLCVLDLIIQNIYHEVHSLSQKQLQDDELEYINSLSSEKNESDKSEVKEQ